MGSIGEVNLPLKKFKKGKVRDVFEVGDDRLLIISSDRISAFDYVLPSLIPDKGKVLNQIAAFFFSRTKNILPNHLINDKPELVEELRQYKDIITGRSILTRKVEVLPVEAIVRGYIVGSGWKTYQKSGEICGISLPSGMTFAQKFPEPIFTPTTKADVGHDENITLHTMKDQFGAELTDRIQSISIDLFEKMSDFAREKGIIIADTKFEFGVDENGDILLVDEIFTPDSSRFWKSADYQECVQQQGKEPPAFDKQYVRNYLLQSDWDRQSLPPELPEDVINQTREKYLEIHHILTGKSL